jgi:nicotinamide-nucleotide amidase
MWFEKDGRIFVSMPGVPYEMKGMMTDSVIPSLRKHFKLPSIAHRTLLTAGVGESFLADHIRDFETALPPGIKLAYLPNYGMVRLRLTSWGEEENSLNATLQQQFDTLKGLAAEWMVADTDISLQEAIGVILKERGKTLGTAESCTGGYIAHLITSIPGSSHYFNGSVVSYSNEIKERLLQVRADTIQRTGAVSEDTVREMAKGALELLHTDYVVATSGIMGPDGGSTEKPVGTVWIAIGDKSQKITAQKFHFRFDRQRNIELTATNALNLLRKFILSTK